MRKRIIYGITIVCLFFIAGRTWGETYQIATVGWAGWSPLHVAAAKGFWESAGVHVEVVNYDDPIIILEAVRAGKIDLAMDMVGSLVGVFMSGEPVLALAETDWSNGGDKIIIHKGHTIAEYINQPVGVFLNQPSCLYFLNRYLETQNLGVSDFRIVEIHPDNLTKQFIARRLPVILNYDPWTFKAIEEGDGEVVASSADFEGCVPECIWGYRDRIDKIPDKDIEHILEGWIDAVQWIHAPDNRKAYYHILNAETFKESPDYPEARLQQMIDMVKIHDPEALVRENCTNGGLYHYLIDLRGFLKKNNLLKRDYQVTEIFDNRWIMAVLNEKKADHGSR